MQPSHVFLSWFSADKYFVPAVTYLLYCVTDYSGRVLAGRIKRVSVNNRWLCFVCPNCSFHFQPVRLKVIWLGIVRIGFIPLLMLCNALPRHHLPILIRSDFMYAVIIFFLAISNGYLTNLTFILIPRYVSMPSLRCQPFFNSYLHVFESFA